MRAITLWQPWASLVAVGAKKYETRSWPAPKSLKHGDLLAAGTVDEDIMAALEQRRDVVTAVVDGLRSGRRVGVPA